MYIAFRITTFFLSVGMELYIILRVFKKGGSVSSIICVLALAYQKKFSHRLLFCICEPLNLFHVNLCGSYLHTKAGIW